MYQENKRPKYNQSNTNGQYNKNNSRNQDIKNNAKKSIEECFSKGLRENNKLKAEVLLIDAPKIAKILADSKDTRNQIRAFFSEFRGIEYKISSEELFEENSSDIWLAKAKASYKYRDGKTDGKIKAGLFYLITCGVDYIYNSKNQYEAFKDFMKLFEAVVGYSYNENISN